MLAKCLPPDPADECPNGKTIETEDAPHLDIDNLTLTTPDAERVLIQNLSLTRQTRGEPAYRRRERQR